MCSLPRFMGQEAGYKVRLWANFIFLNKVYFSSQFTFVCFSFCLAFVCRPCFIMNVQYACILIAFHRNNWNVGAKALHDKKSYRIKDLRTKGLQWQKAYNDKRPTGTKSLFIKKINNAIVRTCLPMSQLITSKLTI